jgi:hypothetical protein
VLSWSLRFPLGQPVGGCDGHSLILGRRDFRFLPVGLGWFLGLRFGSEGDRRRAGFFGSDLSAYGLDLLIGEGGSKLPALAGATAEAVRAAVQAAAEGVPETVIARTLGVSRTTVRAWLAEARDAEPGGG